MPIYAYLIIAFLTAAFLWVLLRGRKEQDITAQVRHELQETTKLLLQQMGRQQETQDRNSHLMHTRIDQATRVVSDVQGKLLQLEEAHKQIFELGKDIGNLQKILQAPKLRGNMGEMWLAELIAQIIPKEYYRLQYTFKTGDTCDAIIIMRDGIILPIDSKFSMENFVKMLEGEEIDKKTYRKLFVSDVKKRIDEVAKKYILPQESTLDFAFMYVPAENVYYHAFIQEMEETSLINYAFSKHVIPVSPSSFYAYLQVIMFGLKGMEIEKSAQTIFKSISGLQDDFQKFRETYEKVGVHLRHAQQSLDQSERRLGGIDNRFQQITTNSEVATLIDEGE